MTNIVRWYQSDRNEAGAVFPGVPLGDIDDATWERFPQWVRDSVDAWTVDGRKVYLMSHRTPSEAGEDDAEPVVPAPALRRRVKDHTVDEPSPDASEPEPPPDETPPEDVSSDEGGN